MAWPGRVGDPRAVVAALAVASGVCGIAYELIYARLLTTVLGDLFQVGAAILATFLLGIAAGSRIAHRFAPSLWAIEVAIGVYAAGMAWLFGGYGRGLQELALPMASGDALALVGWVAALLIVPALLIGFSVPLFALLLRMYALEEGRDAVFRTVYRHYNLGAAVCVLVVEFTVLRVLGLVGALLLLSLVNFVAGLWLRRLPRAPVADPSAFAEGARRASGRHGFALAALFAVSVASGVYQMFLYKLAELVFGPFHQNFALVLALVLLGLVVGTAAVARRERSLSAWLVEGSLAVGASLLLVGPWVVAYAHANGLLGALPVLGTALEIGVLAAMSFAPLAVFGGTVPALVAELPAGPNQAGRALAVSSLGNCVGYLLMVFGLYAALPDAVLAALLAGLVLAVGLALGRVQGAAPRRPVVAVSALLVVGLVAFWPRSLLYYGYDSYASRNALDEARSAYEGVELHRRYDSQIALLRDAAGGESLVINGYQSLVASADGHTNQRELLYGLVPALYSARTEHALVLGVGTGITAAATATAYERTTAVELNPAMLELLPRFADHNLGLAEDDRVELVLDDGLAALVRGEERYDAIVNTVTSPLYFSSSKLYTTDFFSLAAERLARGGVYALWFDGRVTEAGARVIFRSLKESFADCAVTYLNTTYLQLVCGNEPLRPRDPATVAWDAAVSERITASGALLPLPELLRAIALPGHALFQRDWDAPANTFDRPVLEFLMAGRAAARQGFWSPYALLEVELGRGIAASRGGVSDALATRCYALRVMGFAGSTRCLELLAQAAPAELPSYASQLRRHEEVRGGVLRPAERLSLARRLVAAGHDTHAGALLAGVTLPPRHRPERLALEARLRLRRGEPVGDRELAELTTAAPLDPSARELVAEALFARGEVAMARAHARFLGQLGPPSASAVALMRAIDTAEVSR